MPRSSFHEKKNIYIVKMKTLMLERENTCFLYSSWRYVVLFSCLNYYFSKDKERTTITGYSFRVVENKIN